MFARYGLHNAIIKGTKVKTGIIEYNGKSIKCIDSYAVITEPLKKFPAMFGLEGIQKELFPYDFYTINRIQNTWANIEEVGFKGQELQTFNKNIDMIQCRSKDGLKFNMIQYAQFYCTQDVNILKQGFMKFRDQFITAFKLDPFQFLSISSMAYDVFKTSLFYPNGNLFEVGGVLRLFCSKAIHGGRCMCAHNKKWDITVQLSDFDAVSLYPSAMKRIFLIEGIPKLLEIFDYSKLKSFTSAFIVEIEITKVNKHYPFSLIIQQRGEKLVNDDNITEPIRMFVDDIFLEDLIKFQKIEFTILRGYYWDGKKDDKIQETIQFIFDKRSQLKKEKNPLQNIYKLIMNSCYGKSIQKPIDRDYKFKTEDRDYEEYICRNYYHILEDNSIEGSPIHMVKVLKPIDKWFNFTLMGCHVLSMSKRIMNEVMCLAYDIGCHIYYQDTDSMHIECEDIPKLQAAFKETYGRELIGSEMGQFHSDFEPIDGEVPVSRHGIFVAKKVYLDELVNSKGHTDFHIRAKGLTQESILAHGNPLELYKALYDGQERTFDLTEGRPAFKMRKDMTVETLKEFKRTIKCQYPEGKREEYFQ
jgi:hypothetical protein